jgi:hypothetical protein
VRRARRAVVAASVILASCALTLPFAAPARAVAPIERVWSVTYNSAGYYELRYADSPGGSATVLDGSCCNTLSGLAVSRDGTRVIYSRDNQLNSQVMVRDASGRFVRSLVTTTGSTFTREPQLSPDGKTAAWTEITYPAKTYVLRAVPVAGGVPTTLKSGYAGATFLDNGTVLAQNMSTGAYSAITLAGATQTVTGLPSSADQLAVSGSKIAWHEDTTTGADFTGDVRVATLTSGPWAVGDATTLSETLNNDQPAFSKDGVSLYWVQDNGRYGPGDLVIRPVDASAAAVTLDSTTNERDVAVTSLPSDDVTAPGTASGLTAKVNGVEPTLSWTLPLADADISGVLISRYAHGSATPQRDRTYVPATTFKDSGLVLGHTYDYKVETIDRAGNIGPAVMRSLQAIKPGPVFGIPTSAKSTKTSFPVSFAAGALSTTKFWVDYLPAGWSTWQHWVNGATGPARTFGVTGTTGVASTTATAGQSYTFRVKVQDAFGNLSDYVNGSDKAIVPYDQTKASLYGGTNVASSSAYLGSYRRLTTTSQYAKVTLVGNRLQVVGWKCSGCGSFAIYDGATRVATVSTYSTSTIARTVLYTRTYTSSGTHTFTIKPVGTAGHPAILLDGFAMRR